MPKLWVYSHVPLGKLGCLMSPLTVIKLCNYEKGKVWHYFYVDWFCGRLVSKVECNGVTATSTLLAHLKLEKVSGIAQRTVDNISLSSVCSICGHSKRDWTDLKKSIQMNMMILQHSAEVLKLEAKLKITILVKF